MAEEADVERRVARARLQAKRAVLGVALVASLVVIAQSVLEIAPAVFGSGVRPLSPGAVGSPARACAEGILRLTRALSAAQPSAGSRSFEPALSPTWTAAPEVERACAASPEGLDAWAALQRLRRAEELLAGQGDGDLAQLRREVEAHLPADLR